MKHTAIVLSVILAVALCLPSCSGEKTKKSGAGGATTGPAATAGGSAGRTAGAAAKKFNPAEFLASIPCKLDSKSGAFAIFPSNPVAGQVCFSLTPRSIQPGQDIPSFDIKSDELTVILHQTGPLDPASVRLLRLEARDGKPCLESGCRSEVPSARKTYNAPGNSGWTYLFIIPDNTVPLSSGDGYYGIVTKNAGEEVLYIPLFR